MLHGEAVPIGDDLYVFGKTLRQLGNGNAKRGVATLDRFIAMAHQGYPAQHFADGGAVEHDDADDDDTDDDDHT